MFSVFETHNKRDGKAKTCKFCHKDVWWNASEGRWYDPGGTVLHTESCELRKRYYHERALDREEARRSRHG